MQNHAPPGLVPGERMTDSYPAPAHIQEPKWRKNRAIALSFFTPGSVSFPQQHLASQSLAPPGQARRWLTIP